ncbi:phosphate-selective porin [Nitrosomonas sp. Nm84]|uniref:OprO/OprP family phosphate-selective porin n=1 Tax=Nitrosomonas sp. Nm84 TaxID=200124 RepID=UPI000D75FA0B|nr:porin [Nitrosomonas sp. Nm84]PXW90707.1 phosphate-selective porin [Nitrosomonas sp. Nm84]
MKYFLVVFVGSIFFLGYAQYIFAEKPPYAAKPDFEEKPGKELESKKYILDSRFDSGIFFSTPDKNFQAKFGALLQFDGISLNTNKAILDEESGVRRSRLILDMLFLKNWQIMAMYDVAVRPLNLGGFQYFYIGYLGIPKTRLTLGNQQEKVGLEWNTSSQEIPFLERSIMTSLLPPMHLGILANTHGDSWSYGLGVFGGRITEGFHFHNNWGASSRFTYTPIRNDDTILHLGISSAYRDQLGIVSPAEVAGAGTSNAEAARFSSSENLSFYNQLVGTEVALRKGSFTAQFEYLRNFKNAEQGIPKVEYDSWYVQGVWILTGEVRNYISMNGIFGSINPIRKSSGGYNIGAWEIAVRYAENNVTKGVSVLDYDKSNITIGLNWHLSENVRVITNYIRVESDQSATPSRGKEYANAIGTRIQINF